VTVSVIVAAPTDDDERFHRLVALSQQLWRATEQVCAAEPDCTPYVGSSYHYLDDGSENARPCDRCRRWATDVDHGECLDPLERGSVIGDRFLCEQCRVHLIQLGELPDPMSQ
jgi:hypothetical protein